MPQVDSSPLFKGLLMSKVSQVGFLEGIGHLELRAFGHLDRPGALGICRALGVWGGGRSALPPQ